MAEKATPMQKSVNAGIPLRLAAIVLVAGAALMMLQMTGSRILAPRFGSTIFVWGSLISVFIGALAIGYFAGGRAADRWGGYTLLGIVVGAACIYIMCLPFLGPAICGWFVGDAWNAWESGRLAVLGASIALFAIPSILLGSVSPAGVRLAARDVEHIGSVAGRLYALGTLGSLVGTLAAAFVLIPVADPSFILRLTAAALLMVTLLALMPEKGQGPKVAALAVAVVTVALALPAVPIDIPIGEGEILLDVKNSAYHRVAVVDTEVDATDYIPGPDGRFLRPKPGAILLGKRYLWFYCYTESAIHLGLPGHASAAPYTDLCWLPLIWQPDATKVLFLGGGGGVVQRRYHDRFPEMHVDFVEIDQAVIDTAKEYFFLKTDKRLVAHCADGRQFVNSIAEDVKYDIVLIDVFTLGARVPFHMTTKEFLKEIMVHLSDDGIVFMNVISSLSGKKGKVFQHVYQTFASVFPEVYVFRRWPYKDTERGNIAIIGTTGGSSSRMHSFEMVRQAHALRKSGAVPVESFIEIVGRYVPPERIGRIEGLHLAEPLTDDWAPLDSFAF